MFHKHSMYIMTIIGEVRAEVQLLRLKSVVQ